MKVSTKEGVRAAKSQRNWQLEELRTLLLAWDMAAEYPPNNLISESLEHYGFDRIMVQIERKKSEFLRAYTLVKPHMELLNSIHKNRETKEVEISDKGSTCSIKAQKGRGDAVNERAGRAASATTNPMPPAVLPNPIRDHEMDFVRLLPSMPVSSSATRE